MFSHEIKSTLVIVYLTQKASPSKGSRYSSGGYLGDNCITSKMHVVNASTRHSNPKKKKHGRTNSSMGSSKNTRNNISSLLIIFRPTLYHGRKTIDSKHSIPMFICFVFPFENAQCSTFLKLKIVYHQIAAILP